MKRKRDIISKVKVKLSLCLTNYTLHHEDVWESGCIDASLLDLGSGWRWMISFTHRPLYRRRKSSRRLGGPHMEKWKFLTPPGLELLPLGRSARRQPLYWQRYSGIQYKKFTPTATLVLFKRFSFEALPFLFPCQCYFDVWCVCWRWSLLFSDGVCFCKSQLCATKHFLTLIVRATGGASVRNPTKLYDDFRQYLWCKEIFPLIHIYPL
jgi:hypothetical protein